MAPRTPGAPPLRLPHRRRSLLSAIASGLSVLSQIAELLPFPRQIVKLVPNRRDREYGWISIRRLLLGPESRSVTVSNDDVIKSPAGEVFYEQDFDFVVSKLYFNGEASQAEERRRQATKSSVLLVSGMIVNYGAASICYGTNWYGLVG